MGAETHPLARETPISLRHWERGVDMTDAHILQMFKTWEAAFLSRGDTTQEALNRAIETTATVYNLDDDDVRAIVRSAEAGMQL